MIGIFLNYLGFREVDTTHVDLFLHPTYNWSEFYLGFSADMPYTPPEV